MQLGSVLVGVVAVLCGASSSDAQRSTPPTPADTASYRVVSLADGVYAFVAPDGITPMVSGNSTVIVGDDAVLVVDTGQFPSVARWQIGRIRALTRKPVRYIVNTHWHPDHWVGNAEFLAEFPGATIISTAATALAMRTDAQQFIDPKAVAATRDAVERVLKGSKDRPPLSEANRAWYAFGAGELRVLAPQLLRRPAVYPTLLFTDQLTLKLGKRDVEVRFLGRGNTAGDAIVYVPDAKVLVTGDLLVHPYPYGFGSFISEWIETLGRLASFDAAAIVPGHGAVEHDKTYLTQVIELLDSVQSQARAKVGAGFAADSAARSVDVDAFERAICAGDSFCQFGVSTSFTALVRRAVREAIEGKLTDEK